MSVRGKEAWNLDPGSNSEVVDTSTAPREDQVRAVALRLFKEKGYHATSMQDIAAAVGLYKGSLYHYIGGKEDLLVQVFERANVEIFRLQQQANRVKAEVDAGRLTSAEAQSRRMANPTADRCVSVISLHMILRKTCILMLRPKICRR